MGLRTRYITLKLARHIIQQLLGLFETLFRGCSELYIPRMPLKVGGPASFMRLFAEEARRRGLRITNNRFAAARCALIPISMDSECLRRWKSVSAERRVFQRLDGVFYDPERSDFDETRNLELRKIYHELADGLIYQSEYSRAQCLHFLGKSAGDASSCVVYNGTDLGLFTVNSGRGNALGACIRFISTGNFRDPEMLTPLLDALDLLEGRYSFTLDVVGPVDDQLAIDFSTRDWVRISGGCNRVELAAKLHESDIFLFSFLNPNCPNSVIEATACGLPVVSFRSGAMAELCGFNEVLLAPIETVDPVIHKRSELEAGVEAFAKKIELCVEHYSEFREKTIVARSRFDIHASVEAYFNAIFPKS